MATTSHLGYLDGWRGLAILFLLTGHFFAVPGINLGAVGVNLFFVLSGVLMARLLFIRQVPLPTFYKRRIARIFPAAACFIALVVILHLASGLPVRIGETLAALTFVNNYVTGAPGTSVMPFGHFWSLSVEEHSYILLSLVALAARARLASARNLVLSATLAIAGCATWYGLHYGEAAYYPLSLQTEVAAFGIFASAALMLYFEGRTLPRLSALTYLGLAAFGMAMHWWSVPNPVKTIAGVGALALTINLLANAPPSVHAALSLKPLRMLGTWSFSLYVWQQPFYLLYKHHGLSPLVGAALALCAGVSSFYLVEQPARTWLNRKWSPEPAQSDTVQARAA